MFAVVISEKGGAERREAFERLEISVGRVQGNDLMLPKGNVSKRHARLLYRDGRFIVTDLNSTNGTYVNRRRISQATIVREGDRIYIGDFVLRIEASEPAETGDNKAGSGSQRIIRPGDAQPEPLGEACPPLPAPPRVPAGANVPATAAETRAFEPTPSPATPPEQLLGTVAHDIEPASLQALVQRVAGVVGPEVLATEMPGNVRERVIQSLDEQTALLEQEGLLPAGAADAVKYAARLELLELGPLSTWLGGDDALEISVPRHDRILVSRDGQTTALPTGFSSPRSLSWTLQRLCRQAGTQKLEEERLVHRQLPDGTVLWAMLGDCALTGPVAVIRKGRPRLDSLDDFVRAGALSRAMATFLQQCVSGRANLLVVGHAEETVSALVSALSAAAGSDDQLVVIQDEEELASEPTAALRLSAAGLGEEAREIVRMATRIPRARITVEMASRHVAEAIIAAIGAGASGVIGVVRAASYRQALSRLTANLLATCPGVPAAAARGWIHAAFELIVEVGRLRDGRYRVLKVAEMTSPGHEEIEAQEVFSFAIERTAAGGAVEGSFYPSGAIPRVVEDMTARGISVDSSLFRRAALR